MAQLFLVPTPLDFSCDEQSDISTQLPLGTLLCVTKITHWICENAKTTRAFLNRVANLYPLACPLQAMHITELPRLAHKQGDHASKGFDAAPLLAAARQGFDIGLVSEAGMPAIADPGSSVVRAAHALGVPVRALTGPVSPMLALASSGLNGQHFAFNGYLPQDATLRARAIKQFERLSLDLSLGEPTQIFIETPYRNAALLDALISQLQPSTRLCVSAGLTLSQPLLRSDTVAQWRSAPWTAQLKNLPAIFLFGA